MKDKIQWQAMPSIQQVNNRQCHLYRLRIQEGDSRVAECLQVLDPQEKARADRASNQVERLRLILARGMLRQLLAKYLNQTAKSIRFFYNYKGKPQVSAPIMFNLSHAHDTILFAFAEEGALVGVDVEYAHRSHNLLRIANRYFSEEEYSYLVHLPPGEIETCFYHIWTQKEAFVKAHGQGLSYGLPSFTVNSNPEDGAGLVCVDEHVKEADEWSLKSFTPFDGMAAAVAIRKLGVVFEGFDFSAP